MAENESGQERNQDPTAKRRQQARDDGQVPRSQEVSTASLLLAGCALMAAAGGTALGDFSVRTMHQSAHALSGDALGEAGAVALLRSLVSGWVVAMLPLIAGLGVVALGVNLLQARGVISWKPLQPKFDRVNPLSGIKRIVSPDSLFNLVKAIAKFAALGLVTWVILEQSRGELIALSQSGPAQTVVVLRGLILKLGVGVSLTFLVIAAADYAFQVFRGEKKLKMTRDEVVREHKDAEGDPHLKARILSIARSRARSRMLQQVPTATVVITNPTHIAVALRYDLDVAGAPMVVAMGQRKLAERIKAIARKSGVPVIENKPVAQALLATAAVGHAIPPALYAAVAEILAWVYRQRGGYPHTSERSAR